MGLDEEDTPARTQPPRRARHPSESAAQQPSEHPPGRGEKPSPCDHTQEPGPNPCNPAGVSEHPWGCKSTAKQPTPTERPPKGKPPRHQDCCSQLIDIISKIPGVEIPTLHKPKQSPARKVNDLCGVFGIEEAVVPLIAALWQRHQADKKPRNDFETAIETTFNGLGADGAAAFDRAARGYLALRASGTVDSESHIKRANELHRKRISALSRPVRAAPLVLKAL